MRKRITQMTDFLIPQLEAAGHRVIPNSVTYNSKRAKSKTINAIEIVSTTGAQGVLWLHDRNFSELERVITLLNNNKTIQTPNNEKNPLFTGHIFYKDNEDFLKNTAKKFLSAKSGYKGDIKKLQLEKYSKDKLKDTTKLKKGEQAAQIKVSGKFIKKEFQNTHILSYYQPKTDQLEEELRTYTTKPIIYDNTHLSESYRQAESIYPTTKDEHHEILINIPSKESLTLIGLVENKLVFSNGIYQPPITK